jgi:Glyoxalase-like domain
MKKATPAKSPRIPRAVDHVVLPVGSLTIARRRMEQLGFRVAADAVHPFGTENCCIYLSDGTYIEPLGIAQRETCEQAAIRGNIFVAHDQAYRFRNFGDGFSAVSFKTANAKADHLDFVKKGMSAGRMLRFKRRIETRDGAGEAAFSLAFAGDLRSPDMFAFTCQREKWPEIGLGKLTRHPNGVRSLREIVMSEPNPTDFQYFLQEVINQRDQNAHSFGLELEAANATISVLNPRGMAEWFGAESGSERGLRCRALCLHVRSLERLAKVLDENGVAYRPIENRIVVGPAPGQGAFLAFEAGK